MKPRALASLGISTFFFCAFTTPQAGATDLYWDADGNVSATTGGSGNWDIGAGGAWRTGSSTGATQPYDNTAPSSITAQFGGTAGTVITATNINVGGITFGASGYAINNGTGFSLNLNPVGGTFTYTTSNGSNTINSTVQYPVANTQVVKTGPGTLVYNIPNTNATTTEAFYTSPAALSTVPPEPLTASSRCLRETVSEPRTRSSIRPHHKSSWMPVPSSSRKPEITTTCQTNGESG